MTRRQTDGLIFLLLGAMVFVVLGVMGERVVFTSMADFKAVYYATGCLMNGCDPYDEGQLERFYVSHAHEPQADNQGFRHFIGLGINLPAIYPLLAPIAILPWKIAHVVWMILIGTAFCFAGYIIWIWASHDAPLLAGVLLFLLFIGSEVLLEVGNLAGLTVSLCVVACFCLVHNRYRWVGVTCLALSLALKPHVSAMIWLYFVLAGGRYRRRALEVLAVAGVVSLIGTVWVSAADPQWLGELNRNLLAGSSIGGPNNPEPAMYKASAHGAAMINMQTAVSVFVRDPVAYNRITYLVCGPLILWWVILTLRKSQSELKTLLALAAISPLSMLPVYHRQHDTRLLLLTVPACAALWSRRLPIRWAAIPISAATFILTGDLPMQILALETQRFQYSTSSFLGGVNTILFARPAPLLLLLSSVFYLCLYTNASRSAERHSREPDAA